VHKGQSLEEAIRSEAARLGFAACALTRADAADAAGLDLQRWLEAGHHGTMGWMEARASHRVSPLALWPGAKSAIALGMSYAPKSNPLALAAHPELGRISVYAQGGDYHKTVKKELKALARFIVEQVPSELKVFVDTAPVMEKPLAQAGEAHQPRQPEPWQLALPRRDPDQPRAGTGRTGRPRAALRQLQTLSRCVSHAGFRRAASDRCTALHFLSHNRT
jgi:hypothetical protein